MYASSIFGWLEFLDRRISEIRAQSPVSQSAVTGQHTEACHLALLELTEQLESLLGSAVVVEEDGDTSFETVTTVLEHVRTSGCVSWDALDSDIASVVKNSSNFRVVDGFVLVPVDVTDYRFNVFPVVHLVADWIEDLFRAVRTILKHLRADGTSRAETWTDRWRGLGALLKDIHGCCTRLLKQTQYRDQMAESVSQYTGTTGRVVDTKVRNTDD